mgnify:FL=1
MGSSKIIGSFQNISGKADSVLTTKADLATYSSERIRLGVGSNDQVLTADSSEATGLKWAAAGGVTVTSQTFSQTSAETTTSTTYVATNFTLTLPTRTGGFAIVTTNFTHKNSGENINYFSIFDDGATTDVYTSSQTHPDYDDVPQFNNHIFSLDGSAIKLYMKTTGGTQTLIFSSGAVEGNMQSLEVS